MLNTPVLFIIFNRPETTLQVFNAIRKAKPKQLFIAADGPRPEKQGEAERCAEARTIATAVDWDCEVKTLFREKNVGCGLGPAQAITWFFENVEQGIILEDDCLPDPTFFLFCEELLVKYKTNPQVLIISGFNQFENISSIKEHYIFTRWGGIWGWATWRKAWQVYNYEVPEWKDMQIRSNVLNSLDSKVHELDMQNHLNKVISGQKVDFWDFQWWFYRLLNKGVGIVPKHNLITNIGFGDSATHTFDKSSHLATFIAKSLTFPLVHPNVIRENKEYEKLVKGHMIPDFSFKEKFYTIIKNIRTKLAFKLL